MISLTSPASAGGFMAWELTSGTLFNVPPEVKELYVFACGATGGVAAGAGMGGSGGAAYSEKHIIAPASSYAYSIGAGGTNAGTAGGLTTFDTINIPGTQGVTGSTGGQVYAATGGDYNVKGGNGGNGNGSSDGGGGGGSGSRAGRGGTGGDFTGTNCGGGGGTGWNNAALNIAGGAAVAEDAGVLDLSFLGASSFTFRAGTNGSSSNGGDGAGFLYRMDSILPIDNIGVFGGENYGGGKGAHGASGAETGIDGYILVIGVL